MIEFSGVRSSWLTLAQNRFLDSDAAAQLLGLLVQFPVQRDHAPVGLLEFVRQLAVQGHHAAVGLLELGVEQQELLLLLLEVLKRRDEILVVAPQFFQRGLREHGRQLLADGTYVELCVRRATFRHADNLPVGHDSVHQASGRGDARPSGGLPSTVTVSTRLRHVRPERDDGGLPGGDRAAAYLAEGGGDPHLILPVEAEPGRQLAAEPARGEDSGQVPDVRGWRASSVMA